MLLEGTGRAGLSHSSVLIEVLHCRQKSDVVSKQLRPIEAHFKIYWNKAWFYFIHWAKTYFSTLVHSCWEKFSESFLPFQLRYNLNSYLSYRV